MLQRILLVIFISALVASCNNAKQDSLGITLNDSLAVGQDSLSVELTNDSAETPPPVIKYHLLALSDSVRKQLNTQFPDSLLTLVCALNRIDPDRLHRADTLLIPDSIYLDLKAYSPFPDHFQFADSIPKLILVSYYLQAFSLYTNGQLERWGPVSMGSKKTKTPVGKFHTNWKSKRQISTDNSDWILPWYFNLINATGVSFHQFELPGFPASHSCIRLRQVDAEYIYYYGEQWKLDETGRQILQEGSPVIIFGEYPFGKTRPWFEQARNPKANRLDSDSLAKEIGVYFE